MELSLFKIFCRTFNLFPSIHGPRASSLRIIDPSPICFAVFVVDPGLSRCLQLQRRIVHGRILLSVLRRVRADARLSEYFPVFPRDFHISSSAGVFVFSILDIKNGRAGYVRGQAPRVRRYCRDSCETRSDSLPRTVGTYSADVATLIL